MSTEFDDEDQQPRRKAKYKIREQRDLQTMAFVMSTPEGRRFMNWLLSMCGIMKLSYSGPGRAEETAFHEGQRNIGNQIFRILDEHFPKEYSFMREEYKLEGETNG